MASDCTFLRLTNSPTVAIWLSDNALVSINEVTLRRARLVLGRVTVRGYTVFVFNQATRVNSAFHPSGVVKSKSACLAGVKAGRVHSSQVAGNTGWQVARSSVLRCVH